MPILTFTLSEEGVSGLRDALICMNKFSDDVSLEARKDSVIYPSDLDGLQSFFNLKIVCAHRFEHVQIGVRVF